MSLLKLACEGDNLLAQHYQLQCGFLQFGDKGKCPLVPEVGFHGSYRLVVVIADGLELMVKLDKAAMDYYIRLTNFYHQFQAIGNNYNQTVRAVKANFGDKRAFALVAKLEKATLELVVLSKQIIALTREFEERYLNRKSGG